MCRVQLLAAAVIAGLFLLNVLHGYLVVTLAEDVCSRIARLGMLSAFWATLILVAVHEDPRDSRLEVFLAFFLLVIGLFVAATGWLVWRVGRLILPTQPRERPAGYNTFGGSGG